jgi:hypothetical protein
LPRFIISLIFPFYSFIHIYLFEYQQNAAGKELRQQQQRHDNAGGQQEESAIHGTVFLWLWVHP